MSAREQEARRYTSICMLREEIRNDMEDYKLLWTDEYVGVAAEPRYLFNRQKNNDIRLWFSKYLHQQINNNLSKLKQLVEQNND